MPKITFGSDPEVMLIDRQQSGKVVSAIPILKTNKERPIKLGDSIRLYADNVLAEVAHSPVESSDQAVEMYRRILQMVLGHLGKRYSILPRAAHTYDKSELMDRAAWEIGCDPTLDGYREQINPKQEFVDGMRTGSLHIHIGHERLRYLSEKANFVKLMDIYVGCASMIFDKDPTSKLRRRYYGRAGEFRDTPYGVEWRVLGNYHLRSPALTKLVFDLAQYATTHIDGNTVGDVIGIKGIQMRAQRAINDNEPATAIKVLNAAGLPASLMQRVLDAHSLEPQDTVESAWGLS